MLTFNGEKHKGPASIGAKLTGLPFQQCKHVLLTVDYQPSGPGGGVLVFVTGIQKIAEEEHPLRFSEIFHLVPTPQGSFSVLNDIFRSMSDGLGSEMFRLGLNSNFSIWFG